MTTKAVTLLTQTPDQISAGASEVRLKSRRRKPAAVAAQAPEENKPVPVGTPAVIAAKVEPAAAPTVEPASTPSRETKTDQVVQQLRTKGGVTIAEIMAATGWQAHSVRGFFSAVVRKKLGLDLVSTVGEDGTRRYRIDAAAAA